MTATWINRGPAPVWLNMQAAATLLDGVYVGQFCVRDRNGNWSESHYPVFFVDQPKQPDHKHYVGLSKRRGLGETTKGVVIFDATSVTEGAFGGVVSRSGEIIYSRSGHDFRSSTDGSISVDGGRDCMRVIGDVSATPVSLRIVRENIVVNDTIFLPYERPVPR